METGDLLNVVSRRHANACVEYNSCLYNVTTTSMIW
jgi:hypothetical protein